MTDQDDRGAVRRPRLRGLKVKASALTTGAVLAIMVAAVGARTQLLPGGVYAMGQVVAAAPERGKQDTSPPPLPPDVTLTTLHSSGFAPTEITHAAGRFRIVIENRSEVKQLDLRLDEEESGRWREEHAIGEIQGWIARVELEPGTYTIKEAHHPGWVCRLTVTAN